MRFEVLVEREFPHPIERVWAALTDPGALGQWLMHTDDFLPEVGRRFEMYCIDDEGHRDVYRMEVLELETPRYMLWSWLLAGSEHKGVTNVEFRLTETQSGTNVAIRHSGDRDEAMLEMFRAGWARKLETLHDILSAR